MTSSPSPTTMTSMAGLRNQRGSRDASCPPMTMRTPGISSRTRRARRKARKRSVVKLHWRPTMSGAKLRILARPCSTPSRRMSTIWQVCPSSSSPPATHSIPSGSTKVIISRPMIPPIGALRNETFMGPRMITRFTRRRGDAEGRTSGPDFDVFGDRSRGRDGKAVLQ